MNYIRIDEENTHNMGIAYNIWPYNDRDLSKDTIDFISSYCFSSYDEAAEVSMSLLKDAKYTLYKDSFASSRDDFEKLTQEVSNIEGFFICESLFVIDKDSICIDCPTEYMFEVGQVFKEDCDSNEEECLRS